jgi:hypothetical protein
LCGSSRQLQAPPPRAKDFGELVRGDTASGYFKWTGTPDGLEHLGDTRLFLLGTEDISGEKMRISPGDLEITCCSSMGVTVIDCSEVDLPEGSSI